MLRLLATIALLLVSFAEVAALEAVKVADGVYALVGEMEQRSPANLGNNATFGLVVTDDGAVLIDPGGSYRGAAALHEAVRAVTDKPVRYVIDSGGQDHRWLGNGYWREQGAKIVAAKAAVADHRARASLQLSALTQLIGADGLAGTEPAYADIVFDDTYRLELGGVALEIRHAGGAHTPGDSFVFLPRQRVVFTGDIIYVDRLLGVLPVSKSASWIAAFEALAALEPQQVVPGHGRPCDLAKARAETYDYLVGLRRSIAAHIAAGGEMNGAARVDQSAFGHLAQFEALAGRNAEAVFAEMEFE